MYCYICLEAPDKNIPLLKCGHYICSHCYCQLKSHGFNSCSVCSKKLIRGSKKISLLK